MPSLLNLILCFQTIYELRILIFTLQIPIQELRELIKFAKSPSANFRSLLSSV